MLDSHFRGCMKTRLSRQEGTEIRATCRNAAMVSVWKDDGGDRSLTKDRHDLTVTYSIDSLNTPEGLLTLEAFRRASSN